MGPRVANAPRYQYVLVPTADAATQRQKYTADRVRLRADQQRPGPKWRFFSKVCQLLYTVYDMDSMGVQFFDPVRLQVDINLLKEQRDISIPDNTYLDVEMKRKLKLHVEFVLIQLQYASQMIQRFKEDVLTQGGVMFEIKEILQRELIIKERDGEVYEVAYVSWMPDHDGTEHGNTWEYVSGMNAPHQLYLFMAKNRQHPLHKFDSVEHRHHLTHQAQIGTDPTTILDGFSRRQILDVSEFIGVEEGILTNRSELEESHRLPGLPADSNEPFHAPNLFQNIEDEM
jgi:hypothetical protein